MTEDMMEFGLRGVSTTRNRQGGIYSQHLQIDEVVQKKGCGGAQESPPVLSQQKSPRDIPRLEVTPLENSAILHVPPCENNQYGKNNRYAIHGVVSSSQVVIGGDKAD